MNELGPNQELRAQGLTNEAIQEQVKRTESIERATEGLTLHGLDLISRGMEASDVAYALEEAAKAIRNYS